MTKRAILAIALGALLGGGATVAQQAQAPPTPSEQPRNGRGRFQKGGGPRRMFRALHLTASQKQEIRGILKQSRAANADTREQLKALRAQERDAIKAGASEAELQSLANSAAPLMSKMHASRLVAQSKIHAVLTPEQRRKAEQMRNRFERRFEGRQKGGQNE